MCTREGSSRSYRRYAFQNKWRVGQGLRKKKEIRGEKQTIEWLISYLYMVRTRWIDERGRRLRRDGGQSSSFRSSCVSTSCGVFCIERRNIHACMCVCVWWFIGAVEQVETRESPLTCPSFLPLLSHSMFHLIFIFFLLHMQGNPKHPPPATTSLLSSCIAPALLFSTV